MRRGYVAFIALTLVGLGLTGCGLFRFEQREPWRTQAEEACLSQKLVQPSAYMSQASKVSGPGVCGMDYPFKVAAFANGTVGVNKPATLACPIIPRIDTWLDEVVKPAAALYFGTTVLDVRAGSYSCRPRNNQRGAKYSEHSFGNALDVMAFVLADGREITVERGWRGNAAEQEFLREVFVGACRYFTTVLGPGADPFHYDHFHLDLARHDPRGERRICKPILKFAPRLDMVASTPRLPMENASADLAPIDIEQDVMDLEEPAGTLQPVRGGYQASPVPGAQSLRATPPSASGVARPGFPPAQVPVYPQAARSAAPPPYSAQGSPAGLPQRATRSPSAATPMRGGGSDVFSPQPLYNRPPPYGPTPIGNGHGIY